MGVNPWRFLICNLRAVARIYYSVATQYPRRFLPMCEHLEERNTPDDISAGPNGIDAGALGLTGQGIYIGQVEPGRPGKRPFDSPAKSHPDVTPAAVFFRDGAAVADRDIQTHPTGVAGVMIA